MEWIDNWRAARRMRASPYRAALAALPPGLQACWRHDAPYAYPGIPTDAWFFACAAEGLMDFFDAASRSSRPCMLPSHAADSVWRIWLRHDAPGLARFCHAHFGMAPAHAMPAAPDQEATSGALLDTLKACARITGTPPLSPRLPAVFGLDARLAMPGGHGYWSSLDGITYAALDASGRATPSAEPQPAYPIPVLYGAGLLDRQAMVAHLRRSQAPDDEHDRIADDDSARWSARRARERERREYERERREYERERRERERRDEEIRSGADDQRQDADAGEDGEPPYSCGVSRDDDRAADDGDDGYDSDNGDGGDDSACADGDDDDACDAGGTDDDRGD